MEMKLLWEELNGYIRFRLRDIRTFRITFTESIQLILGTNGCGKSSLVESLTCLSPNPEDFRKGGSWGIGIQSGNDQYVLSAKFHPTKHSFRKNDEELNEGGTREVQRKLCATHFNMTPELHDVLLGRERFTAMGPAKRREWLMRLSQNNYEYALFVYNNLKSELNDIKSTLRQTKKRFVDEQGKSRSQEEVTKIQREVDEIHRTLNVLMENRAPLTKPIADYEKEQKLLHEELVVLSNKLHRTSFAAPYGDYPGKPRERNEWGELVDVHFENVDQISQVIGTIKSQIAVRESHLNVNMAAYSKKEEVLSVLLKSSDEGMDVLHERVKRLQQQSLEAVSALTMSNLPIDLFSIGEGGIEALDTLSESLLDVFMNIPDNADRRYGSAKGEQLAQRIVETTDEQTKWRVSRDRFAARKAHADEHKSHNELCCPKCHHQWVAGYSEPEYNALLAEIARHEEMIERLGKQVVTLQEEATANATYGEQYRSFIRITQRWDVLQPFWKYLLEEDFIVTKPRSVLPLINRLRDDLVTIKASRRYTTELEETLKLIAAAEKVGDASVNETRLELEKLSHEIEHLTVEKIELQRAVQEHVDYHRRMTEGLALGARIDKLALQAEHCTMEMVEMMRRDTIAHCIRQLQTSLARKEETLSYVQIQRALVDDIEEQIRVLSIKEIACAELVDGMSPTEGLIAEGLLGFIRYFINDMNGVIARIWSYPLSVGDCAAGEEGSTELDYKFPLYMNEDDEPVKDIAYGSTGLKEVIDLAFKMCAMKALGLTQYPLYLDEFGPGFDAEHRAAATMLINNIMESKEFNQLFMISHYESSYGAMTNAEVCVLDKQNITIPSINQYNQHVTMN